MVNRGRTLDLAKVARPTAFYVFLPSLWPAQVIPRARVTRPPHFLDIHGGGRGLVSFKILSRMEKRRAIIDRSIDRIPFERTRTFTGKVSSPRGGGGNRSSEMPSAGQLILGTTPRDHFLLELGLVDLRPAATFLTSERPFRPLLLYL